MTPLERLAAALEAWRAAPIGGVEEYDAANGMYAAGAAVLAELAAPRLEAAA